MEGRREATQLCKIVYFDEDSVTDYVQMVDGGELEKTTELLKKTTDSVKGEVDLNAKIGFSDVVKALFGVGVSAETGVGLRTDFDTSNIAKNIVKNTMLTDFVNIIYDSQNKSRDSASKPIFKGSKKDFNALLDERIEDEADTIPFMDLIQHYNARLRPNESGVRELSLW